MPNNLEYKIVEQKDIFDDDDDDDSSDSIVSQLIKDVDNAYEKQISSKPSDADIDLDSLSDHHECHNDIAAWTLHYDSNGTRADLEKICQYYNINTRKLKKYDMALLIAEFECNEENKEITERRKYFWDAIKEMNADSYLSKFILIQVGSNI